MLSQLAIAITGLGLLMTGWYVVQGWVRRHSPEIGDDCDILEGRWGCGDCILHGRCKREE